MSIDYLLPLAAVTTRIPGYKSIWGLDLQSYQVHARCILLAAKTGSPSIRTVLCVDTKFLADSKELFE